MSRIACARPTCGDSNKKDRTDGPDLEDEDVQLESEKRVPRTPNASTCGDDALRTAGTTGALRGMHDALLAHGDPARFGHGLSRRAPWRQRRRW